MVALRVDPAAAGARRDAGDGEAVVARDDPHPDRAERRGDRVDPVGLLHAELLGAAHVAGAVGVGRQQGEERQLVDEAGHLVRPDRRGVEGARAHLHVADRLEPRAAAVEDGHACAHPPERVEEPGPARVEPEAVDGHLRPGDDRSRDEERGRRGEVARHLDLGQPERAGGRDGHAAGPAPHRRACRLEHQLGVVAGGTRLGHRRLPLGVQAGEEDGGLHLRARDRKPVRDPPEPVRAPDDERKPAAGRLDGGAHRAQRLGDALHRPRPERLVAGELEAAVLAGEDAREQARERAGVRAVDRPVRGAQPAQPDALDAELVVRGLLDHDAERAHCAERRLGVGRAPEAADAGLALRESAEQDGPVRDRLVPGDGDVARQRSRGQDPHDSSSGDTSTA